MSKVNKDLILQLTEEINQTCVTTSILLKAIKITIKHMETSKHSVILWNKGPQSLLK